jgi:hypothetical protein
VSGENATTVYPHVGRLPRGIMRLLIKISGRRTTLSAIIISPGFSVGSMANIPSVAKQNAGRTMPNIKPVTLKIYAASHARPMIAE